jgi:hypothetical protein
LVKQSVKGTLETSFCPFSLMEEPEASPFRLFLRNLRLNAQVKMWKDLRHLLFTFGKVLPLKVEDGLIPALVNSIDIDAHFDNVTELPQNMIRGTLKWLRRKGIKVPSYKTFTSIYQTKAHDLMRKGAIAKIFHDYIFGTLDLNQIEVRVYFKEFALNTVVQT